ncbi:hypothetical protein IV487_13085 [Enterococcus saccharolyticus]|uniref:Uncharacterized protein n=1 Tax=Candidatus Enterococcus willemsii TaxID=1857215 RepID=A0ABQ6Z0X7_9ENTE|nr:MULTISPECIES: hypothetical protein [Enterococcus]KAF1304265.1 hypothetical protein BAU17_12675 [Enterococcus sp. CU12B]MCD5003397.1 hypothetical protein [Enterococcus saccharolyticus]
MSYQDTFLEHLMNEQTWHSFQNMSQPDQQMIEIFALATLATFQPEKVTFDRKIITNEDGTSELCYTIRTALVKEDSHELPPSLQ